MRIMKALSFAFALLLAVPAWAVTITGVGDTFDVNFDGNVSSTPVPGLTASASFEVTGFSSTSIVLDIDITNTSDGSIWENSRISALGFNTDPILDDASVISGIFDYAIVDDAFPNGFGSVDVCVIDNRNNCKGGTSEGVLIGETESIRVSLSFDAAITELTLSNFGVRYQSLDSEQLGIDGDSGTGREIPPIPEPSAALLFVGGALMASVGVRKQR